MAQTWERFFNAHAPHYMDNVFTQNTLFEVEFLLEELGLPPGAKLLDIGCGTGRHSIELARRGYQITGIDLSSGMLAEAQRAAEGSGVEVTWIQRDATDLTAETALAAVRGTRRAALEIIPGSPPARRRGHRPERRHATGREGPRSYGPGCPRTVQWKG